jgi:hypothetical protein
MGHALIDIALATGNAFLLIRNLIEDDFKRNYKDDPGSIMVIFSNKKIENED